MGDEGPRSGGRSEGFARAEADRLAAMEYWRFGALLQALEPEDWSRPTDCTAWTVRDVAAHVVGATEANASLAEMLRQLSTGRRGLAVDVDPVSAAQVATRRGLPPEELLDRFRRAVPRACTRRARLARLAGQLRLRVGEPVHESWRLRYLLDVIYTRDVWMHRIDVSRAVGREPVLTAEHDGRIVADVVADWLARHGEPVLLHLTGPAGGRFGRADDGSCLELDAVEFCRILSGRATGQGLLAVPVPF